MKHLYKFSLVLTLLFLAACGDDNSSSAAGDDPENTSSSSEETSISSSSRNDEDESSSSTKGISSSSTKDSSSSSSVSRDEESSSSKGKSSSSNKDNSSSSEEKSSSSNKVISSSSEVLTDPTEIFKTRVPKREVYNCVSTELAWEEKFDQVDWICSFKYDGDEGYVYVQGSPTSCEARFSMTPIMSIDTAVFYVNGKYETLKDVSYNWGGNHHNDRIRFSYDGKVFEYNHSSYGWGGRSCQEMDCLKVYEADGKTLIEDGCGLDADISSSRKLPVVCRAAGEDGKFDDFTDTFQLCMGDYRIPDPAE